MAIKQERWILPFVTCQAETASTSQPEHHKPWIPHPFYHHCPPDEVRRVNWGGWQIHLIVGMQGISGGVPRNPTSSYSLLLCIDTTCFSTAPLGFNFWKNNGESSPCVLLGIQFSYWYVTGHLKHKTSCKIQGTTTVFWRSNKKTGRRSQNILAGNRYLAMERVCCYLQVKTPSFRWFRWFRCPRSYK